MMDSDVRDISTFPAAVELPRRLPPVEESAADFNADELIAAFSADELRDTFAYLSILDDCVSTTCSRFESEDIPCRSADASGARKRPSPR